MDIITLITGLSLIGVGFLVKSSPNLIAGYNTLSEERKRKIDIDGLSTFMRNGLIAIGLSMIAGYYLFNWIGLIMIANLMIVFVPLLGAIILVIGAQRFDPSNYAIANKDKKKKTKLTYFILGFVTVSVIGLITYGLIPSKAIFNDGSVRFTGIYGFDLKISDIESIELADRIPTIKLRTNGFSLGTINKGTFNLDGFGKSRLLIHSDRPPFLIISNSNGERTIINYNDKVETEETYTKIKLLIDK